MEAEDADLFKEIDAWFAENLPWPPQCKNREPVVCWFKTENSAEMMKMIRPALWLLERYEHPYFLVYTNTPGDDVLMITADHGCDPGYPGTDHTREAIPLLMYGRSVKPRNLGTHAGFDGISRIVKNYLM